LIDTNTLVNLEKICFPNENWNEKQINSHLNFSDSVLIHKEESEVVGYVFLLSNPDFIEILKIGVTPLHRNKGIANKLIETLKSMSNKIFLEVREDNLAARNLYLKNQFKEYSIRKKYYKDECDAICYIWENLTGN